MNKHVSFTHKASRPDHNSQKSTGLLLSGNYHVDMLEGLPFPGDELDGPSSL